MKTLKLFLFAALVLLFGACKGEKTTPVSGDIVVDTIVSTTESSDFSSDANSESEDIEDAVESAAPALESSEQAEASETADSEDWDGLLQSYEQYADKCIALAKKAANGDMSALTEYPALMEKAQEFSDKMINAQGSMSASQWAKYNKITMKMAKAAGEMH